MSLQLDLLGPIEQGYNQVTGQAFPKLVLETDLLSIRRFSAGLYPNYKHFGSLL